MTKITKLDPNSPDMPKMLDGKNVAACFGSNLAVNMNDPDDLEGKLLEMAHELVVNSGDDDFKNIGRCLKPMISGFCEALRIHNKSRASNGIFVNALINIAGIMLGTSINACAKPHVRQMMADEALNGIKETIDHSLKNRNDAPSQSRQENQALELLTQFIASKQKGQSDA